MSDLYESYKNKLRSKTIRQLEKELESWRSYFQRHNAAYHWHGSSMTAPGQLSDGDKFNAVRSVLQEKQEGQP